MLGLYAHEPNHTDWWVVVVVIGDTVGAHMRRHCLCRSCTITLINGPFSRSATTRSECASRAIRHVAEMSDLKCARTMGERKRSQRVQRTRKCQSRAARPPPQLCWHCVVNPSSLRSGLRAVAQRDAVGHAMQVAASAGSRSSSASIIQIVAWRTWSRCTRLRTTPSRAARGKQVRCLTTRRGIRVTKRR